MQTVTKISNLDEALRTKNKLEILGVPVSVSGCSHLGYTIQTNSANFEKAKQALNSTEVIQ